MLKLGYLLYIAVLIFAPVALGATHIWAKMTVESTVFLAFFLVLFEAWRTGSPLRKVPALWPAVCFVCWIAVQLIPLPSSLLAILSPAAYELYATIHGPAEPSFWAPVTISPLYTVQELFRYAAFVSYYFLTIQLLANRQQLKQVLAIALSTAGILAFQAILQAFAGNGKILWLFDPGPMAFFGTFYYRNHFAGFMALLLPVALALFLYYRPRAGTSTPFRQRIIHILDQLKQSPSFRYGVITLFCFAAILLSQSRAGICVALLTSGSMLLWGRKLFRLQRTSPLFMVGVVLVILLFVGSTELNKLDSRFGEAVNEDGLTTNATTLSGRTGSWQDCLHLIADFPVTGSGFGSFFSLYPSYNHSGSQRMRQAHNDYLETAIDGGFVALVLVAWFLVVVFRRNASMYRQRKDSYARHLYTGLLTGIIALLLHSITEYQFRQTMAIPLYFFAGLGLLTVVIHSRKEKSRRHSLLPQVSFSGARYLIFCSLLALLLVTNILFHGGEIAATSKGYIHDDNGRLSLDLSGQSDKEVLLARNQNGLRAAGLDLLNPLYPLAVAHSAQLLGNDTVADRYYRRALMLDPANADGLQIYGEFLSGRNRMEDALRLMQAAVARDINSAQRHMVYVLWLLGQQENNRGIFEAREMLEQYPQLSPSFCTIMDASPLPPEILPQALPERVEPYLAYAALLEKKGQAEGAAATYTLALSFLEKEAVVKATYFTQPLHFFRKQKEQDRILTILKTAVNYLPNNFSFHLQLGDTYARQGMTNFAVEAYKTARQIRPADLRVQQRIENLMIE